MRTCIWLVKIINRGQGACLGCEQDLGERSRRGLCSRDVGWEIETKGVHQIMPCD